MHFEKAERLKQLPPYLFAEIDKKKKAAIAAGKDIINLGIGDPDLPTPDFIIEALCRAAHDARNHQYALDNGLPELRRAFAEWFERRFGVSLDPDKEVYPLIGSKEGIAHLPLAILNPGDVALVPDPGYPVYRASTVFAGAEPHLMPLCPERNFLPDLESIPCNILKRARLMFLNYPNNPTAAIAPAEFCREAVAFAQKHGLAIANDMAYSEIAFEDKPISLLALPGGKDVVIEFHSLSKTFNMTGWRIAFAAGNADLVAALGQLKTNLDSGIFQAIQYAGIAALRDRSDFLERLVSTYRRRRDVLIGGLRDLGWQVQTPKATFYSWIPVPGGGKSTEFVGRLLDRANVVCTPGVGFGAHGEGFFRMTITTSEERLREAVRRIAALS